MKNEPKYRGTTLKPSIIGPVVLILATAAILATAVALKKPSRSIPLSEHCYLLSEYAKATMGLRNLGKLRDTAAEARRRGIEGTPDTRLIVQDALSEPRRFLPSTRATSEKQYALRWAAACAIDELNETP